MTITQQEAQWIQETVEKLKTKWKPVTERNVGKIPYSSKDGVFDDYFIPRKIRSHGGPMASGAASCGRCIH